MVGGRARKSPGASTGEMLARRGGLVLRRLDPREAVHCLGEGFAELVLGQPPEKGENAVVFWPNFEAAGMSSFRLAGGVAFSF